MSWDRVTVGELVSTKKGFAFKSDLYVESGVPIVRVSNFTLDSISDEDLKYYPERERVNYSDFVLREKDIIVQTVGSWQYNPASVVGKVVHAPYYLDGALLNQNAVKLIPNERVDRDFLYYRLRCDDFKGHVIGEARGAANQASITLDTIKSFSFDIPDYELQCKISAIIAAYDNLIENNQKQIKLLEEAAQRLYKEWFVDLRFPGYEDTPIVDGVPEGWTLGELGDIAIDSGKKEKKEHRGQYQYYLPIDCLPKRSLAYTDKNDITLAESSLVAFMPNDILFGAMRPYFHKVVVARDKGLTRTTCFVINSKMPAYWAYLLLLLFSKDTVDYATQISVGTTMPYVRWKDFIHMPTLIPPEEKCDAFQAIVLPIIERISCLAVSSERLIQARDRLLPKLMSGEIEV
ncbi:restriction endonuclease subunit S [Hominifimenecus microfluidus]|uniref:restriction endonuclease subunit S n=1 Tax=Hominifimenecus microfluidus TaxID=2885348 RepID=UPI0032C0BE92